MGNFDKGFEILVHMNIANSNNLLEIESEDRIKLKNWIIKQNDNINIDKNILSILLYKENKKVTILIWIMWFILSFVYYGIIYIIPKNLSIINPGENNFLLTFISVFGEIPSYFIAVLLVENENFGRKNSLVWGFLFSGFFCILPYFLEENFFIECLFMAKFFINFSFLIIYPFTGEIYHTKYRTTGLGLASGVSRIGGMIMPWITLYCFNISPFTPYLLFGVSSIVAGFAAMLLPYDTRGRELDKVYESYEEEQNNLNNNLME